MAMHAVERADRHGEGVAGALGDGEVEATHVLGGSGLLLGVHHDRADRGVRADEGALVALDALGLVPVRNHNGDAALLVLRGAELPLAVGNVDELGDGQ